MANDHQDDRSAIYLVHSPIAPERLAEVPGVLDHHVIGGDLAFVETELTRSRLYHEVKWAAPPDAPLLVVELQAQPKLKGMEPGAVTWIRDRLPDA